ncbi:MAG: hypothetical protein SFH39_04125 [Candidatus Magnetobacterium sp. LHC-1]|uniref:Secreted protein n=1 Tax=Candidatus Magnetobacterium casense TaxID=1455061 RepID=A0ABS6S3R2_9BACT|nr:hypothetical protein [Candidatus Magnetobacterium casensis]MBF0606551.1 hypothetical protein [Nitrospirota bacterium]MBV6343267.1 hypothetical protein [Candidatus Magnetobacterium casensis]
MRTVVVIVAFLLASVVVASAFNQSGVALDERINSIQREIDAKISNRQLTPKRAEHINIALSKIRDAKAMAIAAGRLTPQKVHKLNAALDKLEQRLDKPKRRYR